MIAKLRTKRGFTLVELMIVVAIVGVLAALAIYGVTKYVANAKTGEARQALGRMAKDASTAYQAEKMDGTVLGAGESVGHTRELCPSSGAVPPGSPPADAKYQSKPEDWTDDGWNCLGFSMTEPQYYQYQYVAAADGFSAIAKGDLDGDTTEFSTFELQGQVDSTTDQLLISPSIIETNPEE